MVNNNYSTLQTLSLEGCSGLAFTKKKIEKDLCEGLDFLMRLDLRNTAFDENSIQSVTKCEALSSLEFLNLSNCQLGPISLQHILDSSTLKSLQILGIASNPISPSTTCFSKEKGGILANLKVIDNRYNKTTRPALKDPTYCTIVIFSWSIHTESMVLRETYKLADRVNYTIGGGNSRKAQIQINPNPLHIFEPTFQQIEMADKLF